MSKLLHIISVISVFCWILIGSFSNYTLAQSTPALQEEPAFEHALFDAVLLQHVNERGEVDYAAFKEDKGFQAYLDHLNDLNPSGLTDSDAIAFWINVYNAYTIKLIIDHYPVGSIKEITPLRIKGLSLAIPKINSPFEYKIASVGGEVYTLDYIEHKILRKQFDEPRIHFALVCASYSCPPLRREAYAGSRLDKQLEEQAHAFLHDPKKNKIDGIDKRIQISKIFKWFNADFTRHGNTLQEFLSPYFEDEVRKKLEENRFQVSYLKYNWKLNDIGSFNN